MAAMQAKMNNEIYISPFASVSYDRGRNVVLVEWKRYCHHDDYRAPLKAALNIMRNFDGCNYVADTRNGFENHDDDTQWVAEYFFPQAVLAGCQYIYFIVDEENSLQEELEGQKEASNGKLLFRYIHSLEELKTK